MTSCILTLIKNEHEYLKEFIDYHLSIGINHIIIGEDYDSYTHEEIINKYSKDKVTLINISSLLDTDDVEKRRYHIFYKRQIIYIKCLLKYIKENYNYDWCFYIDSDEYITLDSKYNNVNKILSEYIEYDAVLLNWKTYGANGLIYKPDYSKKGIIDTYINQCDFQRDDKYFWYKLVKTIYNMNRFTDNIFSSECVPNSKCNWCKTNYLKDTENLVYDKMYIRHYITKSWEEYVYKIGLRGMFYQNHRDYESFFEMNPDMLNRKEELLNMIDSFINKNINIL